jgi:hypothetical protein
MALSRRSFLGLGLVGAGLLALGGVGLRPTVLRAATKPLRALDERTFSVLAAFAERVAPGGGAFPAASGVQVAEKVDALLATCAPGMVAEIKQALLLFDNALAGLLLDQRPSTFTACDPATQDAILESWKSSRLDLRRRVYKALRGLCAGAYYGSPEVYAAIGYPGPPDYRALMAQRDAAVAEGAAGPENDTDSSQAPAAPVGAP